MDKHILSDYHLSTPFHHDTLVVCILYLPENIASLDLHIYKPPHPSPVGVACSQTTPSPSHPKNNELELY
jgi:hypothetical protein